MIRINIARPIKWQKFKNWFKYKILKLWPGGYAIKEIIFIPKIILKPKFEYRKGILYIYVSDINREILSSAKDIEIAWGKWEDRRYFPEISFFLDGFNKKEYNENE